MEPKGLASQILQEMCIVPAGGHIAYKLPNLLDPSLSGQEFISKSGGSQPELLHIFGFFYAIQTCRERFLFMSPVTPRTACYCNLFPLDCAPPPWSFLLPLTVCLTFFGELNRQEFLLI